jgi:HEAT repeat protein
LHALRDSNEDVQRSALYVLAKGDRHTVPKADLLPLLNSTQSDTVLLAANFLRWGGRIRHVGESAEPAPRFTSAEAAPLMTNKFGNVRLRGLLVMQEIADATAVELTLPLLRDTNSIVRSRAFSTLQAISGKSVSDDDPAKWEAWWAASKASFIPRRPVP